MDETRERQVEDSLSRDRKEVEVIVEASRPYVGHWNRLISTTNWEKGRIISEWRTALIDAGARPIEYSDDVWSQLVGGVTGQHVGRLRRVFQRFGQSYQQYDGLYWSHFQGAIDWDDAEMWLEGAVQSGWSVAQMRQQRREVLGEGSASELTDDQVAAAELDEDFESVDGQRLLDEVITGSFETIGAAVDELNIDPTGDGDADQTVHASAVVDDGASIYADNQKEETIRFVRPFENLNELPGDLAEAFEGFKLAILRHRADDWQHIPRDDVLASLDALKELVLAPTAEGAPF